MRPKQGGIIFLNLSRSNTSYDPRSTTERKHNNYLKAARGGVTCKSLLHLAKQADVEPPEPYRHTFNLHTGFETIRPKMAKKQRK